VSCSLAWGLIVQNAKLTTPLDFRWRHQDTAYPSIRRLNRYLRSVGRYGSSGFLVAQYGGAGEIAQAFCR
jgi:RAB protein geranylgeranyltransferase component A